MRELHTFVRAVVIAAFGVGVLVALGSWLVRTRRVSPFGTLGRGVRAATDPLIRPVERRLVRLGGNPVHAGWWLVVVLAIAGVVLLSLLDWAVAILRSTRAALTGGPRAIFAFSIVAAYDILVLALLVRVVASWFGMFRYARWMRPAYLLTDWLVEPIRRFLPPLGMFDWSPLAAWLVLWVLRQVLLAIV